jgi:hypothetical protein
VSPRAGLGSVENRKGIQFDQQQTTYTNTASEVHRPTDQRLSQKLVPTSAYGIAWPVRRIPTSVFSVF